MCLNFCVKTVSVSVYERVVMKRSIKKMKLLLILVIIFVENVSSLRFSDLLLEQNSTFSEWLGGNEYSECSRKIKEIIESAKRRDKFGSQSE